MNYIPRNITAKLQKAAQHFPAILLTGVRQCGKTTLLKHVFPKAHYVLLEDPDVVYRVGRDPKGFLDNLKHPVILDEIQNIPELFGYIRTRIDANPEIAGQWLLTGSQEAPLMQGITESMAGRLAVMQLYPLSVLETDKVSLLRGGFAEVVKKPAIADIWFQSYIQTYLERDVRGIAAIKDLSVFRRFMGLLASRHGNMLNKTDLAAPLGVSVPTISSWLNTLEITSQIIIVPPYFENFGKRSVKSPKLYFTDSGLVCYLLGIDSMETMLKSPFYGTLFEGFVASEVIKYQANSYRRTELYYFRDQQGLEVDFVIPQGAGKLLLVEAKATKTLVPSMAQPLNRLTKSIDRYQTRSVIVHCGILDTAIDQVLAPGTIARDVKSLLNELYAL
ncbi:MAG: ATP-binding protein [Gammaproteobacteria bacterium]|nr:ATP-binding protein [Gammaproteobacteria bacterium]